MSALNANGPPGRTRSAPRPGRHEQLPSVQAHGITNGQLATPAGLSQPVHAHITTLDALLCLATGGDQTLKFQKLIELHDRWGMGAVPEGRGVQDGHH